MKGSSLLSPVIRTLPLTFLFISISGTALPFPLQYATNVLPPTKIKRLNDLCNFSVEVKGEDNLNKSIKTAAATILSNIQKKFQHHQVSRCVVLFPDGKYVDETIEKYNRNRVPEDKENTAFLMIGTGIKTILTDPVKRGQGLSMVNAEETDNFIPAHWQKSHLVDKTITLEKGQKLIGIPLTPDAKVANNFYIGLERTQDNNDSEALDKGSLVESNAAGILITGLSTASAFEPILSNHHEGVSDDQTITTHHATFGLFNLVRDSHTPLGKNGVTIFNNELVQLAKPAIIASVNNISLDSDKLAGNVFFDIENNHFISTYDQLPTTTDPVLLINAQYPDDVAYSSKDFTVLKLHGNHFFGDCKKNAIHAISDRNKGKYVIDDNVFECLNHVYDSAAIKLEGIFDLQNFQTLSSNNRIIGYQYAIGFDGAFYLSASESDHQRFARESEQDKRPKDEKSPGNPTSSNNPDYIKLSNITLNVVIVLSIGILAAYASKIWRKVVDMNSALNNLRKVSSPQAPGNMPPYAYHALTNQPDRPQGCQQVVALPPAPVGRLAPAVPANHPVCNEGASTSGTYHKPTQKDVVINMKTFKYFTEATHNNEDGNRDEKED